MQEAVPSGVAHSFSALIPAAVVAFVVLIINGIFISLGTDIYNVVAIPFGLLNIHRKLLAWYCLFTFLFTLCGLLYHGANIVMGLVNPILLSNMAENVDGAHIAFAGEF